MKVIIDLCLVPIGVGISLSPYIAACEKVLMDAGLKISLHSYLPLSNVAMRWCMKWAPHVLQRPLKLGQGQTVRKQWRIR
jgi:uncharacterized protein YqgV (UPF0045/DUF77 family)